jgi:tetratricopeptide (TPR) repeat protein
LLYLFVVTLIVGIVYSEVQALLTDPASALDPSQLRKTLFWQAAATHPIYFVAVCLLAVGAAVLGWRLDRRYAAQQQEQRHLETAAAAQVVAEAVVQRAQAEGQLAGKTIPRDLPPRAPGFVGRQQDLQALDRTLRQGQALAIVGMGGLGKSSLAAEAVHALAAEPGVFSGGITWVRCDERNGLDGLTWIEDQLLAAWGAALPAEATARAATPEEGLELRERALRKRLGASDGEARPSAKLVLLDNVEPDLLLSRLLDTLAPLGIAALVTTRVEPTSPHIRLLNLEVLDDEAGARLFAERYADRGGRWDAARDNDAMRAVVDALGGLPLAIELAAARAARTRLPLATLAEELRAPDALARLNDPRDPSAGVRYSLRKTLLALTPSQRTRFAALGLPEGADWALPIIERMFEGVPAAQEGGATAPGDVEALVAYSLVSLSTPVGGKTPRVRLHPLVRELTREEWANLDEETRRAALGALLAGVSAWMSQPLGYAEHIALLVPDYDLVVGALRQAYREQVDVPLALATTSALSNILVLVYRPGVLEDLANRHLQAARTLGNRREELAALDGLAQLAEGTGHGDDATRYRQEALPIARELREQARVVEYTAALGSSAAEAGRLDEAQRLFDEALSTAKGMGEDPLDGRMYNILGILAVKLGHLNEAGPLLERATVRAHDTGDLIIESLSMYNRADVYEMQGDYAAARRLFDQGLAVTQDATAALGLELDAEVEGQYAAWYDKFGEIALKTGNLAEARAQFEKALHAVEASHYDPPMVPHLKGNLAVVRGEAARLRGDAAAALQAYQEALDFYAQETPKVYNHMTREYVTFVQERMARLSVGGHA